jgi:hypothetical protein
MSSQFCDRIAKIRSERVCCSPRGEYFYLRQLMFDRGKYAGTRRARTRTQSSPSISAANCAADSRITPSSTRGQRNLLPSSLLANRHRPVPSQKISFTLSARFARKQKITPEKRVGLQLLFHQRRKPVHPFAEVHRLRRHQDPERTRRNQHPAAHAPARRTARKIASTSRVLAPPGTRTWTAPHRCQRKGPALSGGTHGAEVMRWEESASAREGEKQSNAHNSATRSAKAPAQRLGW